MSCFNCDFESSPAKLFVLFNNAISIPGVSITVTNPFNMVNYLLSLVIPYSLSTIAILSPIKQLNKLLFPQFGKPIKDTLYFYVAYFIVVHYFSFCFLPEFTWRRSIYCGVCKISCLRDLACCEKLWCNLSENIDSMWLLIIYDDDGFL